MSTCLYKNRKTGLNFQLSIKTVLNSQLTSCTPPALLPNVVHEFSCLHDAVVTYMDMTSRHLVNRAQEHLNLNFNKIAVTRHISACQCCKANKVSFNLFEIVSVILRTKPKFKKRYLLKNKSRLNSQFCAKCCSFCSRFF